MTPFAFAGRCSIVASGRSVLYASSDAAALGLVDGVEIFADGVSLGILSPGDSHSLENPAVTWQIAPLADALTGIVKIGNGSARSNRMSGQVEVIDNSAAKTQAGGQYTRGQSRQVLGAGQYVAGGVHAPTKRLALRRFAVKTSAAGNIARMFFASSAPASGIVIAQDALRNKRGDAVSLVSTAYLWHGKVTAISPPPTTEIVTETQTHSMELPSSEWVELVTYAPLVLNPGWGFFTCLDKTDQRLDLMIEAEE